MGQPLPQQAMPWCVVIHQQCIHTGLADHQHVLRLTVIADFQRLPLILIELADLALVQVETSQAPKVTCTEPRLVLKEQRVQLQVVAGVDGRFMHDTPPGRSVYEKWCGCCECPSQRMQSLQAFPLPLVAFLGHALWVSGAKKPTRDGPDIFPFRVLYSPTPDITGIFHRRRETAGEKKPHGCRVRRTALVEAFLRRRDERVGACLEVVKHLDLSSET